ncbi:hypothetical protein AB0N06_38575 [Streptomyces sp. NPDC051020]|uniref:hypothetical protein n=1 Tax=Streptomyces sp. NPDC051020 TaxID=3155409 RepID=UPI003422515D
MAVPPAACAVPGIVSWLAATTPAAPAAMPRNLRQSVPPPSELSFVTITDSFCLFGSQWVVAAPGPGQRGQASRDSAHAAASVTASSPGGFIPSRYPARDQSGYPAGAVVRFV